MLPVASRACCLAAAFQNTPQAEHHLKFQFTLFNTYNHRKIMASAELQSALQTLLCLRRLKSIAVREEVHQSLPHLMHSEEAKALQSIRNALVGMCAGHVRFLAPHFAVPVVHAMLLLFVQSANPSSKQAAHGRNQARAFTTTLPTVSHIPAAKAQERITSQRSCAEAPSAATVPVSRRQQHRILHRRACRAVVHSTRTGAGVDELQGVCKVPPPPPAHTPRSPGSKRAREPPATESGTQEYADILDELGDMSLGLGQLAAPPPSKAPRTLLL